MSKGLINEFGEKSGYATQNLWYMRQFYNSYIHNPILQQLVGEIPWGSFEFECGFNGKNLKVEKY